MSRDRANRRGVPPRPCPVVVPGFCVPPLARYHGRWHVNFTGRILHEPYTELAIGDLAARARSPFRPRREIWPCSRGRQSPTVAGHRERIGSQALPLPVHVFSEGNVFVQIQENVRGRDTFIIQGVHYPVNDNFVELMFWIDALKRASASR